MYPFLSGMTAMGFLIIALLFIRYWQRTHDSIFVWFGISFAILALTQALAVVLDIAREEHSWVYLLRFLAFGLIIVAILRKNKATSG